MSRNLFAPTKVHRNKKFVVNTQSQVDPFYQRAAWKRNKELDERPPSKKKSRLQYVQSSSRALEDGSSVSYQTGVRSDAIKDYSHRQLMDRLRELDQIKADKKAKKRDKGKGKKKTKPAVVSSSSSSSEDSDGDSQPWNCLLLFVFNFICFKCALFFMCLIFHVQFSSSSNILDFTSRRTLGPSDSIQKYSFFSKWFNVRFLLRYVCKVGSILHYNGVG